jgi:hypothetical protein
VREYKFQFTVTCAGQGEPDLAKVENMIDLSMQDLVYDDEFIAALDESQAVTIQVSKLGT